MTNFVATPSDPETPDNAMVEVDGWFPAISLSSIRATVRIGEGVVTHARLVAAVEGAIITALRALAAWRSAHASAGVASLETLPDIAMAGSTRPVILWQRIIRYYAAAEIADNHRDITATDEGQIRASEENMSADEYRRQAHNAVADLISIRPAHDDDFDPVDGQRNRVVLI